MCEAKSSENLLSPPSLLPLGAPEPWGPPVILGCGSKPTCLALRPWCCCWHPLLGLRWVGCCARAAPSSLSRGAGTGRGSVPGAIQPMQRGQAFPFPARALLWGCAGRCFWGADCSIPSSGRKSS